MRAKPYPHYKPSGVAWLGDLPEHWATKRLRRALLQPLQYGANEPAELDDTTLPRYVRITDVHEDGNLRQETFRSLPHETAAPYLLRDGDLLLARSGATAGKTFLYKDTWGKCAYAGYLIRARLHRNVALPRFVKYFSNSTAYRSWASSSIVQATIPNLSAEKYADLPLPLPPVQEQFLIASFLDRETARLDQLVSKKRELIERLKEKRTALISRTVTRGLPPDAAAKAGLPVNPPLKPSGIDWIGELPSHWVLKRVGDECEFISYGFTNPMPTASEGPRMVTANDVNQGRVLLEEARCTEKSEFEKLTRKSRPKRRDILVTKDGTLGRVAVVLSDDAFCINQSVALLRPKPASNERFLATALQSPPYFDRMVFEAGGTTIKHIYITRLARMPFGAPPNPEQRAIAAYLDAETAKLDALVAKAEEAIERLQEYRTALITSAVTGKIDVRTRVAEPTPARLPSHSP